MLSIDTCPNDCSGHGTCITISDAATLDGPPYIPTSGHSGDGVGIPYTNWDKGSVVMCSCDSGYFGADCSLGE